ncbi:MAG: PRD domain-containing protein, partial [Clostridium paraputrificum]
DIDGTKKFYECLKEDMSKLAFNNMMEELLRLFSTEGIADKLTFLNPDVVIKEVEVVMGKYINYYNINFDGKFKLNLYMHISLMIERILLSARNYIEDEMQLHSEEEEEFFMITKSFFQPIEMKFNINVDSYEISLLYEIFKSYIM